MIRCPALIIAVSVFLGCGEPADLNADMAGSWWGFATLTLEGGSESDSVAVVKVTTDGREASVSGICPAGDGSFVVAGEADRAAWDGELLCAVSATVRCPLVLTYRRVAIEYAPDTLWVSGNGESMSCSDARPFTLDFTGLRL